MCPPGRVGEIGKRDGLKHHCPQGLVGSSPTPGTLSVGHGRLCFVPHVRPQSTVDSALRWSDRGMSDAENAARHGVAVKTIRRWRRLYQRRGMPRGQPQCTAMCPRCGDGDLDRVAYAELLGWYLGDGHISKHRRGVYGLHVVNDAHYPHGIARIGDLMRRVKPRGRPHTRDVPGASIVTMSWKHWPCLFPQHGPGRKHERPIILEDWQREIVEEHPGPFLRGLFHSDGCRVRNWTRRVVAGEMKRYDYPRWQFTNHSADIRELCRWALDLADIAWRQSNWRTISVSRRDAVERLDALIGPKE